jgi:hypothetical protein
VSYGSPSSAFRRHYMLFSVLTVASWARREFNRFPDASMAYCLSIPIKKGFACVRVCLCKGLLAYCSGKTARAVILYSYPTTYTLELKLVLLPYAARNHSHAGYPTRTVLQPPAFVTPNHERPLLLMAQRQSNFGSSLLLQTVIFLIISTDRIFLY